MLADAVCYNFTDRSAQATRELHELLKIGRRAMLVGLPILALSLIAGQLIGYGSAAAGPARVIGGKGSPDTGLGGQLAALEIFLYEWWPIVRRRTLYRRLAEAKVEIRWAENDLASEEEPPDAGRLTISAGSTAPANREFHGKEAAQMSAPCASS